MKSMARVIPTVVSHQFKGMGRLVDNEQIKEEIVTVVDEVTSWGYKSSRANTKGAIAKCLCVFLTYFRVPEDDIKCTLL